MFHVQQRGAASLIEVREDLDIATASTLESAIVIAECTSTARIVVSLEHCPYCDSSGLAALIRSKKRLGDRLIVVVPLESRVRRVFEVTGLTAALDLHPNLRVALDGAGSP